MIARPRYVLKLFVAGASDRSRQAVLQVRELCETRLAGRHELQVIDVHQHPELARRSRVPATPALVRERPRPVRRFFGDLGDANAVCETLGLRATAPARADAAGDGGAPRGAAAPGEAATDAGAARRADEGGHS